MSRLVFGMCGISLKEGKQDLVKARLGPRLRALDLGSFSAYLDLVEQDLTGQELAELVDLITTNKTEFFRDPGHFDFIRSHFLPAIRGNPRIRFWCAGCSFGQEPYSLAIAVRETLPAHQDIKILATDICRPALAQAAAGIYDQSELKELDQSQIQRYFSKLPTGQFQVRPSCRSLVHFARLNLMQSWPMRGPLSAILCRNVMIYFERSTRHNLVNRFWNLLGSGGHLFIGCSESLSGLDHQFAFVQPAIYLKP